MIVEAEQGLCCASGQCVMLVPAVFDQDDDGLVVVLNPEPTSEDARAVRSAVRQCPTRAISIREDT